MPRPLASRARSRSRQLGPVDLAIGFALIGSLLAVAIPVFAREVHASRFVEPVDGLQRIGAAAVAYGLQHPVAQGFPPPNPLTPSAPPRGRCEADSPDAWETPTWRALDFRPVPMGKAHCFAFSFDSALSAARSTFRSQSRADLDGDGILSTFEITGHYVQGDTRGPEVDKGMFVDSEVE
jgi:hypothetical protein